MSAVDVLSVMDSAIERERNEGRAYVAQVAARAAVAELIEAAREELEVGFNAAPTPTRRRLSAALDAMGGEV